MPFTIKKALLIITIIISSSYLIAQSFKIEFDHQSILVKDIEKSADFYKEVLQFKEMEPPWGFISWGKFFDIGNNQQLHLTLGDPDSLKLNKVLHQAYSVNDFDGYFELLSEKNVEFSTFKGEISISQPRPDSVRQIYFQDPDGYWIEINDTKHKNN